jgi:transcriptional regulator GlxA family with amidase domain
MAMKLYDATIPDVAVIVGNLSLQPDEIGERMVGVATRSIVMVAFNGLQSLDLAGPVEVFDMANQLCGRPEYAVTLTASGEGTLISSSGIEIIVRTALADVSRAPDTLMVVGGPGTTAALDDAMLLRHLRRLVLRARRVTSVCSGAFLLAEIGALDGRRATTHWAWCDALADRYPLVEVDASPIYVRDGNVATSAGVSAGMDLALALVEEDLGREVALDVARQLVLFLRRPANQAQLSTQLRGQAAERDSLREAQQRIAEQPGADLSVSALATAVGMSPRNFARCFRREIGQSPGHYVVVARVEAARRLLEDTDRAIADVARACGFGTAETMRRAFLRTIGCGPAELRRRFRPRAA